MTSKPTVTATPSPSANPKAALTPSDEALRAALGVTTDEAANSKKGKGLTGVPLGTPVAMGVQPRKVTRGTIIGTEKVFGKTQYAAGDGQRTFSTLSNPEKIRLLARLSSIPGLYGKNKAPSIDYLRNIASSGIIPIRPEDASALEDVMRIADTTGDSYEAALTYLEFNPQVAAGIFGTTKQKTLRVTPADALGLEFEQSVLDYLDVKVSKAEKKAYAKMVNQLEAKRGGALTSLERQQLLTEAIQDKAKDIFKAEANNTDSMLLQKGALGETYNLLRKTYDDYGIMINDNQVYRQAIDSIRSKQALDNTIGKIKLQAEVAMPALKTYIQQGLTPRDALGSYITWYSNMFEIPETQVDLTKLSPVYSGSNLMPFDEWKRYTYTLPEYKGTKMYEDLVASDYRTLITNFFGQEEQIMPTPTNQAAIDAAKAQNEAIDRAIAKAEAAAKALEPQMASATELVRLAAKAPTVYEKLAQKAAANPNLPAGTQKAFTDFAANLPTYAGQAQSATETIIQPYQQAVGSIPGLQSQKVQVPKAIYSVKDNPMFAAMIAAMQAIGVVGLTDVLTQIRDLYPEISSADALMLLKFDPRFNGPYMTRFAGNKKLMDQGFAPLDDQQYLANEAAYDKIFKAYGLDRFNNRTKYADLIGNKVDPQTLGERVSLGYDRLIKGAKETVQALNQLHPELTNADLLAYVIDPVNQLPALMQKVQAAEIGGAALAQNLTIGAQAAPEQPSGYSNVSRRGLGVEELAAQGVDLAAARRGYGAVAEVLPQAEFLSAIYGKRGMEQYGRLEAEKETFKQLASERRKRELLAQAEIGSFSGQAGRSGSALTSERTF